MKKIPVICLVLLALLTAAAQALEVPSQAGRRFHNESASFKLSEAQADAAEDRLVALEKDYNGVHMAVLLIDSLEGEAPEAFSLKVAEKWKLGRKRGKGQDGDNGLLLVIAVKDKKYRFEVGYGLEGALPDSLVGSIGRDALVPAFKEGRYLDGIYKAIDAVRTLLNHGRRPSAQAFAIPPLGDKRFHNHSTLLKLQDFEANSLENDLDRFEWGLDNMVNMRAAILVIDSLEGEPIDGLAARAAETWKLGQKRGDGAEGDNGLLLVLAMKDRKYWFQSGRKIENLFPETLTDAIARDIMIQDFWAGEYERGLRYTVDAIDGLAQGRYPQRVELAEQKDDRGLWERFTDVLEYRKFSQPTSYDYFYQGRKKVDPAWGQADYKKEVHRHWALIIMLVVAGLCSIYSYLLGGVIGLIEGVSYSWFIMGQALPLVLLSALIGFVVGMVAKYVAAAALAAGIFAGTGGGSFGGGGAGGSW